MKSASQEGDNDKVNLFVAIPRHVIINILKFIDWKDLDKIKLISNSFYDIYHKDILSSLYKKAIVFETWQYQEIERLSKLVNKFLESEKISYFSYPSISYKELTHLLFLFCSPLPLLYQLFDTYRSRQDVLDTTNEIDKAQTIVKKYISSQKEIINSFKQVANKPFLEGVKKYENVYDNLRKEIQSNSQKAEELLTHQFIFLIAELLIALILIAFVWTCFVKCKDSLYQIQLIDNSTIQKLKNYLYSEYKEKMNENPFVALFLESINSYTEESMPVRKNFKIIIKDQLAELLNEANIYSDFFHTHQETFKTQSYLKRGQLESLKSKNQYFSNYHTTITFWSKSNKQNAIEYISKEAPSLSSHSTHGS